MGKKLQSVSTEKKEPEESSHIPCVFMLLPVVFFVLAALFAILKLFGVVGWSWLWVTSPIWGLWVLYGLVFLIGILVVMKKKIRRTGGQKD